MNRFERPLPSERTKKWFPRCSFFYLWLLTCWIFSPLVFSAAPSLELLQLDSNRTLKIRLHGDNSLTYTMERSKDLITWTTISSLRTTNGLALFSFDTSATDTGLFVRAHELVTASNIVIQPQIAGDYSVSSVVTPEGGSAELITPDFQRITLTIPAGCVRTEQEFTIMVISNIVGFPFSHGAFGAVRLEPEDLTLSGAASLEIDLPPTVDLREVASFSANNDGTGFGLVPDRLETNRVLIPITRFATYGSGLATKAEINSILNPATRAGPSVRKLSSANTPADSQCVDLPSDQSLALSEYPPSTLECFHELVVRAIQVRAYLNQVQRCTIGKKIVAAQLEARQNELNESQAIALTLESDVCPFYTNNITPFWGEAQDNCALGVVLVDFSLAIERQIELLGATVPSCGLRLEDNLANICSGQKECLREIKACCLEGYRGWEKWEEVLSTVRVLDLLGDTSCFPNGLNEPVIQSVSDVCITNAWLGEFTVTQKGQSVKTTVQGNSTTTESQTIDSLYSGGVRSSDESISIPGVGKALSLRILGNATVQLHSLLESSTVSPCKLGGTSENHYYDRTDTVGTTNIDGQIRTNDIAQSYGGYSVAILIKPDQTYQISASSDLLLKVKVDEFNFDWTVDCEGNTERDAPDKFQSETGSIFPWIAVPQVRPMPNTNEISGSFEMVDTNSAPAITTRFTWSFQRLNNNPIK